jgi:hypothetical protein
MRLLVAWGFCFIFAFSDVAGTTLAATQLAGLKGVNLAVTVEGDLPEDEARELERTLEEWLTARFTEEGLSLVANDAEWFYFIVKARYMEGPSEDGAVALAMSARLREQVILRRNRRLRVPGGGGLTWWKDALVVTRLDEMGKKMKPVVDHLMEAFLGAWRDENPGLRRK